MSFLGHIRCRWASIMNKVTMRTPDIVIMRYWNSGNWTGIQAPEHREAHLARVFISQDKCTWLSDKPRRQQLRSQ